MTTTITLAIMNTKGYNTYGSVLKQVCLFVSFVALVTLYIFLRKYFMFCLMENKIY